MSTNVIKPTTEVVFPDHDFAGFTQAINRFAKEKARVILEQTGELELYQFADPDLREQIFKVFLSCLPVEAQQHYNCKTCNAWYNLFGGAFQVHLYTNSFTINPFFWGMDSAQLAELPEFFQSIVVALNGFMIEQMTRKVKIEPLCIPDTSVIVKNRGMWGKKEAGGFNHMYFESSPLFNYKLLNANLNVFEASRMYAHTVLNQYTREHFEKMLGLFATKMLIQPERFQPMVEWYLKMHDLRKTSNNAITMAVEVNRAPKGFFHLNGGVVGAALDRIKDGASDDNIIRLWNEMLDPLHYKRPQKATEGVIHAANKLIGELGLEKSFSRRFAFMHEVLPYASWTHPKVVKTAVEEKPKALFDKLLPKTEPAKRPYLETATTIAIGWETFCRDILPVTEELYFVALIGSQNMGYGRTSKVHYPFVQVTTQVHDDAKPILYYDKETNRNPLCFYSYDGGSTPEDFNLITQEADDKHTLMLSLPTIKSHAVLAKVEAISPMPDMYKPEDVPDHRKQTDVEMFYLEEANDLLHNKQSAIFPDTLIGELHPVRAAIEALSSQTPLVRPTVEEKEKGYKVAGGVLMVKDGKQGGDKSLYVLYVRTKHQDAVYQITH